MLVTNFKKTIETIFWFNPTIKLLENYRYLAKYGDFHERLQVLREDHQCFMQFQLPRLKPPAFHVSSRFSSVERSSRFGNHDIPCKYNPLLPSECRHASRLDYTEDVTLPFALTDDRADLEELRTLMQAENFPENLYPVAIRRQPPVNKETSPLLASSVSDDNRGLPSRQFTTSSMGSSITKVSLEPLLAETQHNNELSLSELAHFSSNRSSKRPDFGVAITATQHIGSSQSTSNRVINPYAQLVERLRETDKKKVDSMPTIGLKNSDVIATLSETVMDTETHSCVQKLLKFIRSLDNNADGQLNSDSFDENSIVALFSVDNHLPSSIYVPTHVRQIENVPKSILRSLKKESDDERILDKIQAEMTANKEKALAKPKEHRTAALPEKMRKDFGRIASKDEPQHSNRSPPLAPTPNFVDQDNEINARLFSTFSVKAFREFLVHQNTSARLPKLFHDVDRWCHDFNAHRSGKTAAIEPNMPSWVEKRDAKNSHQNIFK